MAGGTWISQNKVRPGAYINFKGIAAPQSSVGNRGIVALPVALNWGDELTEVLSTELMDGSSVAKIGISAVSPDAQLVREALRNAYKAIVFRLDLGATKATATSEPLTVTAKYGGTLGNELAVVVEENEDNFNVKTLFKGAVQETQTVATIDELVDNKWVVFSGTGTPQVTAGLPLANGTNGTVSEERYLEFLSAVAGKHWHTMAIPYEDEEGNVRTAVRAYIKNMRENQGRKVQAVVFDDYSNYEGIISVRQGYRTETEEVAPVTFTAYVAGLTAGSAVNQSNTYHVIPNATGIIYESWDTPYDNEKIIKLLSEGHFLLSERSDGAIVVEQDINTLVRYGQDKSYAFSKNRVIRVLDSINNDIKLMFEQRYIGQVNNDANGRNVFKADVINYMNTLQDVGAISDFDSSTDIEVVPGEQIDSIVANLAVKPVDSMEKLYMSVLVG